MKQHLLRSYLGRGTVALLALLFLQTNAVWAQQPTPVYPPNAYPSNQPQPVQVMNSNQLDDLVAPIALYPDPLISQVLVAATYPLEIVEASQWLQRNPGLTGPALTQAAAQQNWDPSVQALVMFPDALQRLNEDVNWTTALGNAFLAQQGDVMAAVQRMRVRAEQSGRLSSTPQQQVVRTVEMGQPVVEIYPANPEIIYVPVYDPYWVWGPPVYYRYPRWNYGPRLGFYWGRGISVVAYFGGGWDGWNNWGWRPGWGSRTIVVNNTFINRYNFNAPRYASARGTAVWSHDSYRDGYRRSAGAYTAHATSPRPVIQPQARTAPQPSAPVRSFAPSSAPSRAFTQSPNRTIENGNASRFRSERAYPNAPRSEAAPAPARATPQYRMAPQSRSVAPQQRSVAPPERGSGSQSRGGGNGGNSRSHEDRGHDRGGHGR